MDNLEVLNPTDTKVNEKKSSTPTFLSYDYPSGRLRCQMGKQSFWVEVKKCFPWSDACRFLSLRDADDNEVALIQDPSCLDQSSQQALNQALAETGFCFEIHEVHEIKEEFEVRLWKVLTQAGPRTFETKLTDWPRQIPHGAYLVQDINGDLYRISAPAVLPDASQKRLWAFLGDEG